MDGSTLNNSIFDRYNDRCFYNESNSSECSDGESTIFTTQFFNPGDLSLRALNNKKSLKSFIKYISNYLPESEKIYNLREKIFKNDGAGKIDIYNIKINDREYITLKKYKRNNELYYSIKIENDDDTKYYYSKDYYVNENIERLFNDILQSNNGKDIKRKVKKQNTALRSDYWSKDWRKYNTGEAGVHYSQIDSQISEFVDLVCEKKPGITILELCSGKGELESKILNKNHQEIKKYISIELDKQSCKEAHSKLKKFKNQAELHQDNVLTAPYRSISKDQPDIIIASGALTHQVLEEKSEVKKVIKDLIEVMPNEGYLVLTGHAELLVNLDELTKIYPFKILNGYSRFSKNEFVILQKIERDDSPITVTKKGKLDLFYHFNKTKSVKSVTNKMSKEEIKSVKSIDFTNCDLTEKDCRNIKTFENLEEIILQNVSDIYSVLTSLPKKTLSSIKFIDISFTDIKNKEIKELSKKYPNINFKMDYCKNISFQNKLNFLVEQACLKSTNATFELDFLKKLEYRNLKTKHVKQIINILKKYHKETIIMPDISPMQMMKTMCSLAKVFKSNRAFKIESKNKDFTFVLNNITNKEINIDSENVNNINEAVYSLIEALHVTNNCSTIKEISINSTKKETSLETIFNNFVLLRKLKKISLSGKFDNIDFDYINKLENLNEIDVLNLDINRRQFMDLLENLYDEEATIKVNEELVEGQPQLKEKIEKRFPNISFEKKTARSS